MPFERRNTSNEVHTLTFVAIKAESDKAWNIQFKKHTEWLPKSQCRIDKQYKEIEVPEWLVEQKDLWDYSV